MTITGLIDANGTAVVNYRYDSWGILTGITGSMAGTLGKDNPYRFKGYYYDEETGMYYLKSRYYQPEICRFISADTTDVLEIQEDFDDLNLYTYCNNNPINWEDPDVTIALELGYVALTVLVFTYVYIAGVRRKKKQQGHTRLQNLIGTVIAIVII